MSRTMSRMMVGLNLLARCKPHKSLSALHRLVIDPVIMWATRQIKRARSPNYRIKTTQRMRTLPKSLHPNGVWHSWGSISGSDWLTMVRRMQLILLQHATMSSSRPFWARKPMLWKIWTKWEIVRSAASRSTVLISYLMMHCGHGFLRSTACHRSVAQACLISKLKHSWYAIHLL